MTRVTVEVVVPTLRLLNARRGGRRPSVIRECSDSRAPPPVQIKSEEEDTKSHFLLKANIKVEVKPEEIIAENLVMNRLALSGCNTFNIDVSPDILGVTTTRSVTSRIWGGNMHATLPKIGSQFTHGLDDFMYTNPLYNPHAPCRPGSPGVIFNFKDDGQEWPKIMRLIVRLRDNAWQYMGQYKLTAAPPLTPNEWNMQPLKVRRMWAQRLSSEKRTDCGFKAKIVLRKRLCRDPTLREVGIALRSNEQFDATPREILQAFDDGLAIVHVWCMECVGYDIDFQRRIVAGS